MYLAERGAFRAARSIAGWVLLALFIVFVALWTAFGFAPSLAEDAREPFAAFGRVDAFWPIFAGFLTGAGAAWALTPGLRAAGEEDEKGGISLQPLAAAFLGISSLVMMFGAYWPCSGAEQPVWGALRHSLEAFEGYVAEPFGVVEGCPAEFPQGLTAGVLFGKVTLALVLGIGIAYVFRHSIDAFRARTAPQVVVFSGVAEETAEVIRSIAKNLTDRQTLLLLDPGPELLRARELAKDISRTMRMRAIALPVDATDLGAVASLMRSRGRKGVQALYLMSPDSSGNLRAMDAFLELDDRLANRHGPRVRPASLPERRRSTPLWWRRLVRRVRPLPSEVPGRVIVRIDNPWHAEDWRRRQMLRRADWLFDAVSAHAVAARHVVRRMMYPEDGAPITDVVIDGRSAFEMALLSQLAFEHAVDRLLEGAIQQGERDNGGRFAARLQEWRTTRPKTPRVVLLGDAATEAGEHFLAQLRRYGAEPGPDAVRRARGASRECLLSLPGSALVLGEAATDDPTLLAALHPRWRIFAWADGVRGLTSDDLIGGLALVGPTLEPVEGYGSDVWERLGRINHLMYLLRHHGGSPQIDDVRTRAARGDWDEDLSAFNKESNIRPFAAVSRTVRGLAIARTWATDLGDGGAQLEMPLDDRELHDAAVREHESWNRHHLEHAWEYGVTRDDAARIHDCIVPWDELTREIQDYDYDSVRGALALFRTLGFTLTAKAAAGVLAQ